MSKKHRSMKCSSNFWKISSLSRLKACLCRWKAKKWTRYHLLTTNKNRFSLPLPNWGFFSLNLHRRLPQRWWPYLNHQSLWSLRQHPDLPHTLGVITLTQPQSLNMEALSKNHKITTTTHKWLSLRGGVGLPCYPPKIIQVKRLLLSLRNANKMLFKINSGKNL